MPTISYSDRIIELGEKAADEKALTLVGDQRAAETFTWGHLARQSLVAAGDLDRAGVGMGDYVGIQIPNSLEHVVAVFASYHLGAIPVPVRWDLPAWEFSRIRSVLNPRVILKAGDLLKNAGEGPALSPDKRSLSPNEFGILSSGSSGMPKLIVRERSASMQRDALNHGILRRYLQIGKQVVLIPGPMYHTTGFATIRHLLHGDRVVLLRRFSVDATEEALREHEVTGALFVTLMLQRLSDSAKAAPEVWGSLEWLIQGASPLPEWLALEWIKLLGVDRFFVCYGASEGVGATIADGNEYLGNLGTVGRGADGTEVSVRDRDGVPVGPHIEGEVFMRPSSGVPSQYVGRDHKLNVAADGSVSVGDIGFLNEKGFLFLLDRRSDIIITGGVNVYPAEVEAALSAHPLVADAVVIGVSDREWGQKVHALVQLKEGSAIAGDELRRFLAEKIARHKVPKAVEFVKSIERSEAMKVNRRDLAKERELQQ